MRNNKVLYEAPPSSAVVNVQGEVYTTNPFNPSSIEKMINLRANYSGSNYFTDNSGNVNIPSNFGSVSYFLDGQYAEVRTNSYVPNFTSSASNTNVSFDNSNSTIQERTAYHAVNEIHAHLKSVFPNFTGLDFPLETNVDKLVVVTLIIMEVQLIFMLRELVVPQPLSCLMLFIMSMVMPSMDGDMDLECKMEVKMKDMQIYGQFLSRKTQFWALVGT